MPASRARAGGAARPTESRGAHDSASSHLRLSLLTARSIVPEEERQQMAGVLAARCAAVSERTGEDCARRLDCRDCQDLWQPPRHEQFPSAANWRSSRAPIAWSYHRWCSITRTAGKALALRFLSSTGFRTSSGFEAGFRVERRFLPRHATLVPAQSTPHATPAARLLGQTRRADSGAYAETLRGSDRVV